MIEDSGPVGKPRRLLDLFSDARTARYYSHFGTHLSRLPEKFPSFFSSAYRSAFCNPFAFRFMQEWVGVYPHPRMFLRDVPTFQSKLHRSCGAKIPAGSGRSDVQTCRLLLSKLKAPINHAESTLLKVLILKQLKVPLESITFGKQGGGSPLWLTICSKKVSARIFAGIPAFHSPYTLPSSVSRNPFVCHS